AEDVIRARNVTGVQTCALPIFPRRMVPICDSEPIGSPVPQRTFSTPAMNVVETAPSPTSITPSFPLAGAMYRPASTATITVLSRSEERRVGKEVSGWEIAEQYR